MEEKVSLRDLIEKEIEPLVKDNFMELVDIDVSTGQRKLYIRIKMDKITGGINLDECARMSRLIDDLLVEKNTVHSDYNLEISSPGLDRPLKKPADYKKFEGKLAKLTVFEAIENENCQIGHIKESDEESVVLATKKGERKIPFSNIKKANLEIDF
ncbi:MAG: Ribosome maturation factor RimP [Candidatus Aerophobetes bacterium ADurb.Bin490]|nr:MAG: Ribosome maturation factor RimP [Candidatus Aerophobetes bacterium ADurb.Bin490]HPI02585.1 ribosome maturation factor RimP [Candidatus Goldiibacteriota bacterium]HPN63768.1 ribosome maturation factor RimP [Candidatus Goldiibacteriota bacterium]HRQ43452.1 ribosome maturation factor RimP [Candidatus Goldiibacteriota bacterium]